MFYYTVIVWRGIFLVLVEAEEAYLLFSTKVFKFFTGQDCMTSVEF